MAFANAAGGDLVIGIEDNGTITGFRRNGARAIEEFEQLSITHCDPSPEVFAERINVINYNNEDDVILVLHVKPLENRVVKRRNDGEVFQRQGDKSPTLNYEQIRALEYDKGQTYYENELELNSSLDDVDTDVLAHYKKTLDTQVSDERLLTARGFYREGHLTRAGVLLFAKYPTKFYPCARVRILKVQGTKLNTGVRMNIVKDVTYDGPLPKVIEEATTTVSTLLREFQFLGDDGKFKTIPEYPEFAWFKGLINAVTHRDYAAAGEYIRVTIYEDRLEILSPGKLPHTITLENMRYKRWSRNPNLARTLVDFGWVRELNEGVQRIYDEMQSCFLNQPVFEEPNGDSVLLTLENSATSRMLRENDSLEQKLTHEVLSSLNECEYLAVRYAYALGRITSKEFTEISGKSKRTINGLLKNLCEKDIFIWHGLSKMIPHNIIH